MRLSKQETEKRMFDLLKEMSVVYNGSGETKPPITDLINKHRTSNTTSTLISMGLIKNVSVAVKPQWFWLGGEPTITTAKRVCEANRNARIKARSKHANNAPQERVTLPTVDKTKVERFDKPKKQETGSVDVSILWGMFKIKRTQP